MNLEHLEKYMIDHSVLTDFSTKYYDGALVKVTLVMKHHDEKELR